MIPTSQLTNLPHIARRKAGASLTFAARVAAALLVGILLPALLAVGMVKFNEVQVVSVVLGLLGLLVILARPFWGLIFCVGLIYIRPEESVGALDGMHFTLMVSVVTLISLLLHYLLDRTRIVRTPVNGLLLGFGGMVIVSALGHGNTVAATLDISKLLIFAFLTVNLIRTPQSYFQAITAVLVFTVYLAIYSIYLNFTGAALDEHGVIRSEATGIFSDPNDLAASILAGLALTIGRIPLSRGRARIVYLSFTLIMVWAIMLTNSRGGLIALIIVLSGFFLSYQRRKALALALAILFGGAFLFLAPSRMTNFDTDEESANSRFWFWDNGVSMLIQHPLTGIGYGNFPDENGGFTAHNSFVLCFAELGLPAYFCWMGCLYYCFRRPQDLPPESQSENVAHALCGARLALLGFLSACFWLSRTYIPVLYLLIGLAIAGPLTFYPQSESQPSASPGRFRDGVKIAALCIGSILLIKLLAVRCK